MERVRQLDVNLRKVRRRLPTAYAHVGVYDVLARRAFAARHDGRTPAMDQSHAGLLRGAGRGALVVKDRFMCHWFYPPGAPEGQAAILPRSFPIDWSEANLFVRLDPQWSYVRQKLLPMHATTVIEANIGQQICAARHLLELYWQTAPEFPLTLHMVGPRAADCLFHVQRCVPPE